LLFEAESAIASETPGIRSWAAASVVVHGLILAGWWTVSGEPGEAEKYTLSVDILSDNSSVHAHQYKLEAARSVAPAASRPKDGLVSTDVSGPAALKVSAARPVAATVEPSAGLPDHQADTIRSAAGMAAGVPPPTPERSENHEGRDRSRVRQHLEAHKFYPASARRRGIAGEVEVGFRLGDGGRAEQVLLLASSGYVVLDRAAVETVKRAQPFPVFSGSFHFRLRFHKL
jgi:protein TonB